MTSYKHFLLIGLVTSLSVFAGSMIAPVEARFISSIVNDPLLTSSVFGFASIIFVFLSYWLGRMSDKLGRKRLLVAGLISGVIYAFLYASVVNIFQIYGVKFAWALSAVAMGPVMTAYLQDFLAPYKDKGKYFGYVYSAQSIFGSVGALSGGFLASSYGLTTPFYGLAIVYFVVLILVIFAFKDSHVEEDVSQEKTDRAFKKTVKYVFKNPALLFYLSFNTSFGINWGIKNFLWPLVIFSLAENDLITGSIFATMGMVAFVLLPFAGRLVDKYGAYRITFIQFLILGISGVMMALTDSLTIFWIFVAVYTIGEVLNLAQIVLITDTVPGEIRGEVLGLDAAMDQVLMVASPLLAGALIVGIGVSNTLLVFMSLYWLSLLVGFFVYCTKIATVGTVGS